MPLYLVGLNEEYITQKALDQIKSSDIIIVDSYTMPNADKIASKILKIAKDKNVIIADRKALEDDNLKILNMAKDKNVSIIVPGDPLIATTHESLVIDAKTRGIDVNIINGLSGICMAKSLSGLHYYKFGKTLTIPGPWRNVKAYSLLYNLYGNLCINAHTMLLFDIDDNKKTLSIYDGIKAILDLNKELNLYENLNKLLGILVHVGNENIFVGKTLEKLLNETNIEEPYSLIIPSKLHSEEENYLKLVLNIDENAILEHKNNVKANFCKYMSDLASLVL